MSFIPPSPTSSASSGSTGPRTPDSSYPPRLALPVLPDFEGRPSMEAYEDTGSAGGVKRTIKIKQRISTAERRASHNAVERQRREALNARFLDLAAVLPNLANVRRPSKSAIVNSSIAHINASRRHRILAAQQLRTLLSETQALRNEANSWRARAGVVRLDTPSRPESFSVLMGEELHYEVADLSGPYDEEESDEYTAVQMAGYRAEDEFMRMHAMAQGAYNLAPQSAPLQRPSPYSRPQSHSPVIASPTPYDTYEHQPPFMTTMPEADDKWAYAQQMMDAQGALDTQQILAQDRSRQAVSAGVW